VSCTIKCVCNALYFIDNCWCAGSRCVRIVADTCASRFILLEPVCARRAHKEWSVRVQSEHRRRLAGGQVIKGDGRIFPQSAPNLVLRTNKKKQGKCNPRVDYIFLLVFLLVLSIKFSALWRNILPSPLSSYIICAFLHVFHNHIIYSGSQPGAGGFLWNPFAMLIPTNYGQAVFNPSVGYFNGQTNGLGR